MNFKEYVENAIRTESKFNVMTADTVSPFLNDRLLHAAIWMQTELWEIFEALFIKWKNWNVDLVNVREELWDVLWYFAILSDNLGYFDFEFGNEITIKLEDVNDYIFEINDLTINILDSVKKSLFYKKELNIELLKERLTKLFNLTQSVITFLWGNIEKTAITNIEKLRARYPEKFTSEHAINRDLKTERNILETDK